MGPGTMTDGQEDKFSDGLLPYQKIGFNHIKIFALKL